jgi:hypothetical protein
VKTRDWSEVYVTDEHAASLASQLISDGVKFVALPKPNGYWCLRADVPQSQLHDFVQQTRPRP